MSEESPEKHRQLAVQIASTASNVEKEALRVWIEQLLDIRASNLWVGSKAKQAISLTARSGVVIPLVKVIADKLAPDALKVLGIELLTIKQSKSSMFEKTRNATSLILKQLKLLAWDDKGLKGRLAIAGAVTGLVMFGGQGAGIAALGTAIGVPLWVVFGAGAAFIGVLYEELTGRKPSSKTTYTVIDAERKD